MKKYLVIGIIAIFLLGAIANFDKILIGAMRVVDWYGTATGTTTIEVIDGLNEIYYSLGYE